MAGTTDHIRFKRLEQVCLKALEESQKVLTDENVYSCYPNLVCTPNGKDLVDKVKQQLIDSWRDNTVKEFRSIFEERDIENKLNELDDLIAKAQERKNNGDDPQVPINELTPITIASSHLISLKEDNMLKLEDQLEKLQSANEELYKELQEYAKQASQLRSDIVQDITRLKQVDNVPTDVQLEEQIRSLVLLLKD